MSDEDRIFAHGVAVVCLCLRRVVNEPPLSKFFAYTWRAATGKPEITKHKCTRNKFTCKHWVLSLLSLPNDFHLFMIPFSIQGSLITGPTPLDIVTLDPNKFTEKKQQCLHIESFAPRIWLLDKSRPVTAEYLFYDLTRRSSKGMFPFYPPDRKPFYITPCRQKIPRLQENYAS